MAHIVTAVGIGMALVFGMGVMLGVVVMIMSAVGRQDRLATLTGSPDAWSRPGGSDADGGEPDEAA
jgi:hypothetical protein